MDDWKHIDKFPAGDVVWRRVPRDGYWEYVIDRNASTYLNGDHKIRPIEDAEHQQDLQKGASTGD